MRAIVVHESLWGNTAALPAGRGRSAAFETRFRWSPGGAAGTISRALDASGCSPVAKPAKFIVTGTYGPLRDGETDRARAWGAELVLAME